MWNALKNSFKIPELRSRIIFTFLMLAVFRLGIYIPIPGINLHEWSSFFENITRGTGGGLFTLFNAFAGGAVRRMSIFTMSVTPYINSSIILQLLMAVMPSLKELAREGEHGRQKIEKYTRQLTLVLALLQGLVMSMFIAIGNPAFITIGMNRITFVVLSTTSMIAGSMFLLWLGERITDKGIGNGISVIIFAGVVATYPYYIGQMVISNIGVVAWTIFALIFVATVVGLIYVMQGERRITVQYAKRVVGRKMYGGQSTYIPIKVNQGGVIPIIFAVAIVMIPAMIAQFAHNYTLQRIFGFNSILYIVTYALLVFFFTYFYSALTFDVHEVSENIKEYGGFVPGIRPGRSTENYLSKVLTRVTFVGALALVGIALLPNLTSTVVGVTSAQYIVGGVGMMIAVGVALDVVQQMEAHLIMRHYEGFIKRGRLKGKS